MQHGSLSDPEYRFGDWGPSYALRGETSDIGVLRLRPGDEMTNHIHQHCDESFVVLEGTATLWVSCTDEHVLTVGDVYRCEPNEMHYFVNESGTSFRMLFIKSPASPGDTINLPWRPGQQIPEVPTSETTKER